MIGSIVYPIRLEVADAAQEAAHSGEVGWFVSMPEEGCAFCKIGCCVQRVVSDMDGDALVIHGTLGSA